MHKYSEKQITKIDFRDIETYLNGKFKKRIFKQCQVWVKWLSQNVEAWTGRGLENIEEIRYIEDRKGSGYKEPDHSY